MEVPPKDQGVGKDPLPRHDKGKEQVMMLSCNEANKIPYYVQEPIITEPEEDFPLDEERLAHHLQHSTEFKCFFDFLRFSPEARFEATKAIVEISNKYGDYNMSTAGPCANEMRNASAIITFLEKDHKVPYKHNIPLYDIVVVNGVEFKCAFLEGGTSINAMPYSA